MTTSTSPLAGPTSSPGARTTSSPATSGAAPAALSRLPPGVSKSGADNVGSYDRSNPQVDDAMRADPALPVDKDVVEWIVQDQKRWTRRFLLPWVRVASCISVAFIVACKRMVPINFRWHSGIDVLCIWFVRRFCSVTVPYFLMRHFVIETNLMNFVTRNVGATDVEVFELRPVVIPQLGDNAVIRHDINIYNFLIDLGKSTTANFERSSDVEVGNVEKRNVSTLDFRDISCPVVDAEVHRRRYLNLDIETALYLMNIPFCLLTTFSEYERAVNSFQLDESLFTMVADLTGDDRFRTWTPLKFTPFLAFPWDVPRALYWHACIHEFAHGRLEELARACAVAKDDDDDGEQLGRGAH